MQNGSGTFDPFFVINNVSDFRKVKLGKQLLKSIFGHNSEGYTGECPNLAIPQLENKF